MLYKVTRDLTLKAQDYCLLWLITHYLKERNINYTLQMVYQMWCETSTQLSTDCLHKIFNAILFRQYLPLAWEQSCLNSVVKPVKDPTLHLSCQPICH